MSKNPTDYTKLTDADYVKLRLNADMIATIVLALERSREMVGPDDAVELAMHTGLLLTFRQFADELAEREMQPCLRCGRDVFIEFGDVWTHVGADGNASRGCYSASFSPGNGWDDSINRNWKAKGRD